MAGMTSSHRGFFRRMVAVDRLVDNRLENAHLRSFPMREEGTRLNSIILMGYSMQADFGGDQAGLGLFQARSEAAANRHPLARPGIDIVAGCNRQSGDHARQIKRDARCRRDA